MMEVLMARRKLTAEEMEAKVAKMKATKAANKAKALETLGLSTTRKKVRKTRTMTPEQKAAAVERLAKARASKGPSQNKMISEHVRNLPDDNPLSLVNVRAWIKENKELLKSIRDFKDSKDAKERTQYQKVETYVSNLEAYLRNGVYLDFFYGSQMQNRITHRVYVMAYYPDGTPKRSIGWWYPDVGIYTQEMANEDRQRQTVSN
jgi:hypothetical protein